MRVTAGMFKGRTSLVRNYHELWCINQPYRCNAEYFNMDSLKVYTLHLQNAEAH